MRLRLVNARWSIGLLLFIVLNINLTIWVRRVNDGSREFDLHPKHNNLGVQIASTLENSRELSEQTKSRYSLTNVTAESNGMDEPAYRTVVEIREVIREVVREVIRIVEVPVRANYSPITRADFSLHESTLPSFALDESEFALGSIIERSGESWNLHLTTFMLCHLIFEPSVGHSAVKKVHPVMKDTWHRAMSKFRNVRYHQSGARRTELNSEMIYCRITHSSTSVPYIVAGEFMPNRLTSDPNANGLLDILRCPMEDSEKAHEFIKSNQSLFVEIIRGNISIFTYHVPWRSRRTGFLLSAPKAASFLDSWKGSDSLTNNEKVPNGEKMDKLHICVPATSQAPTKDSLPVYLEFISHHLLIGASHIHLPVPFGWNSIEMHKFVTVFQSYIQEGTK